MRLFRVAISTSLVIIALMVIGFFSIGFYLSPQDKVSHADAIVAISGGETKARTLEAVKLYMDGNSALVVFSGAASDPNGPSNAAAMRALAISNGVPVKDIEIEESSKNTAENATAVAPMLLERGVKSIILVTSPYHQRRASINFHRALGSGVAIINHSAPDQSWRRSHWWATSYSYHLTLSELQKTFYVLSTKEEQSQ